MRALGRPQDTFSDKAIQLQPIFAKWVQSLHTLAPGSTAPNALATASYAFGGDIVAVNGKIAMMPISLGTADFMVHHIPFYNSRNCTNFIKRYVIRKKFTSDS
jgi:photosystem I P700 chlorophyll a apoprotein A1